MLPSGSLFDAHLRQAERILSSDDKTETSGKLETESDGDQGLCGLGSGSQCATDRFVGRLGGSGGEGLGMGGGAWGWWWWFFVFSSQLV